MGVSGRTQCQRGFTLIELMIAVAIIGVLAAVAYPSYMDYVKKSNRAAAQAFLLTVAQRQQTHLMNNRAYANSLTSLGIVMPDDVARYYAIDVGSLGVSAGPPPGFELRLAPIAGTPQAEDGSLCVSNAGLRTRFCEEGGVPEPW
jgi:type IV pilus assembly protein PilE